MHPDWLIQVVCALTHQAAADLQQITLAGQIAADRMAVHQQRSTNVQHIEFRPNVAMPHRRMLAGQLSQPEHDAQLARP